MKEGVTYIFGHKNPDTDTVCAAISLSYLKNRLGLNTIPAVLGSLNAETEYALKAFHIEEPIHLNDVKLQIKNVNYHKNCFIGKNISIKDAFDYMSKHSITGVAVVEGKNKYCGYVSLKEITKELIAGNYNKLSTSYGNILKTLNGKEILKFDKEINGDIIAITYIEKKSFKDYNLKNSSILIAEESDEIIRYAIKSKVKLIILVSNYKINDKLLEEAYNQNINIIMTSYTAYEVGKLLSFSNYINNIIRKEEIVSFNEVDYLSDFLEESKKFKHTNYPILNKRGECKGILALTDCNNVNKKKVILVDHNNYSQSVDGLDEAEILEVIDHHNIGDIVTRKPINFRNARVGSVNTIIYNMYLENNVKIPKNIAGIMASSIISDTLLLTSPTTTKNDIEAAEKLCEIANINLKNYGVKLLKQGMSIKGLSNREILYKDFKSYKVNEVMVGIGQVLTSEFDLIDKEKMINYLDEVAQLSGYKVLALFITDLFNKTSHCLYNKLGEDIIKDAFNLDKIYEGIELKNVLSRKVQIIPYIMDVIEKI